VSVRRYDYSFETSCEDVLSRKCILLRCDAVLYIYIYIYSRNIAILRRNLLCRFLVSLMPVIQSVAKISSQFMYV